METADGQDRLRNLEAAAGLDRLLPLEETNGPVAHRLEQDLAVGPVLVILETENNLPTRNQERRKRVAAVATPTGIAEVLEQQVDRPKLDLDRAAGLDRLQELEAAVGPGRLLESEGAESLPLRPEVADGPE